MAGEERPHDEWRARRARRLEREAAEFARAEALEQQQRAADRMADTKSFKAELEARGGVLFPGD